MSFASYDIVISFSEDQRDVAVGIKLALEALNISAYYYYYEPEAGIGRRLDSNLYKIYSEDAHLAICILSEEYFRRKYTILELSAVMDRRRHEPDYMLPVRIGGLNLPSHLQSLTYYDWDKNPKAIADIARQRLNKKSANLLEDDPQKVQLKTREFLLNIINRYANTCSGSAQFHFSLGLHYYFLRLSAGDYNNAAVRFKKAFTLDPSCHAAMYYYSKAKIKAIGMDTIKYNQIKEPVAVLSTAIILQPHNIEYRSWASILNNKFYLKHGINFPITSLIL